MYSKSSSEYGVEKESLKKHKYKTRFHAFSFGNGLNNFQFGTI
jgi:hypothetical protein